MRKSTPTVVRGTTRLRRWLDGGTAGQAASACEDRGPQAAGVVVLLVQRNPGAGHVVTADPVGQQERLAVAGRGADEGEGAVLTVVQGAHQGRPGDELRGEVGNSCLRAKHLRHHPFCGAVRSRRRVRGNESAVIARRHRTLLSTCRVGPGNRGVPGSVLSLPDRAASARVEGHAACGARSLRCGLQTCVTPSSPGPSLMETPSDFLAGGVSSCRGESRLGMRRFHHHRVSPTLRPRPYVRPMTTPVSADGIAVPPPAAQAGRGSAASSSDASAPATRRRRLEVIPRSLVMLLGAGAAVLVLGGVRATAWLIGPMFLALIVVIALTPVQAWLAAAAGRTG